MDLNTFAGTIAFLSAHGYLLLFAIMFLEGPIITYVAAFAASIGIFNVYWVLGLSILGNTLGDIPYYAAGFWGRESRLGKFLLRKVDHTKAVEKVEQGFKNHLVKTLVFVKLTPGLAGGGLALAGVARVPFWRYLLWCFIVSIPASLIYVLLGYYSGISYQTLIHYLKIGEVAAGITVGIIVLAIGGAIVYSIIKKERASAPGPRRR